MRIVLTLALVLFPTSGLLAATGKSAGKRPNRLADLEQQKKQLRTQERAQLRQIETQFKTQVEALHKRKGEMEIALKEKLVLEKAVTVKRIEQRFAHIMKYDFPYKVWGQLDRSAIRLKAVHDNLKTANADYGGNKAMAIRSLSRAVADLQNRLVVHRWLSGEREGTVKLLRAAEVDLQNALVYSANKWGIGTPKGMPEPQVVSNKQLADALITIDNTRGLILYCQWEEGLDKNWRNSMKKRRDLEVQQTKGAFDARIKNVGKEVANRIGQLGKQLEQTKVQAIAQTKTQTSAAIKEIDAQIRKIKKR